MTRHAKLSLQTLPGRSGPESDSKPDMTCSSNRSSLDEVFPLISASVNCAIECDGPGDSLELRNIGIAVRRAPRSLDRVPCMIAYPVAIPGVSTCLTHRVPLVLLRNSCCLTREGEPKSRSRDSIRASGFPPSTFAPARKSAQIIPSI
jgi:hypothetical protein